MPRQAALLTIPTALRTLARRRCGVLTTRDLRAAGIGSSAVRSLCRTAVLTQLVRGAYSLDADPSPRAKVIAAALICHPQAIASHESAAVMLGWRDPWPTDLTHLWLPPVATRGQERTGVRLHWGLVLPEEALLVDGITVTTPARTARDLLKFRDRTSAVALVDQGLNRGSLSPFDLADVASRLSASARASAAMTDARSESPLESRIRLLLHDAGLHPEPQVTVRLPGGRTARVDLGWPRWKVGVECDGRAYHGTELAITGDNRREDALWSQGWHLVRVTWLQLRNDPDGIVEEVRRALTLRRTSAA